MVKNEYHIKSFEDLQFAREQIKKDNKTIEQTFKQNPVVKISSSLFGGESVKDIVSDSLSLGHRSTSGKIVKGLLLSNKATRKFFVAYTIAKEMVPYTIHRVGKFFKK